MISNKNAILFLMVVAFGTADGRLLGMSLCSESIGDITSCVAQNCPETTQAGYVDSCPEVVDADTCAELQIICDAYADCCGACGEEIKELLNQCTPGDEGGTCNLVTCGTAAAEAEAEPDLCSESIGDITSCVAQNCPETTIGVTCPEVPIDADSCAEVQTMCDGYADCCGACGEEIKELLNQCTPGDEGGTCNLVTCGTAAAAEPEAEAEPEMKACVNEYPFWVSCVAAHVHGGCPSNCNMDSLNTCADLMANEGCCPDCSDQFQDVVDCSSCDGAEAEMEPDFGNDMSEECATCLEDPMANCEEICVPEAEAEPDLCSESIQLITQCVARECPETTMADEVDSCPDVVDADTCAEVQTICDGYADCCGACGVEIAGLLNQCTPGQGGTCNVISCGGSDAEQEPGTPDEDPTDPANIIQPAAVLTSIIAVVAAMVSRI